MSWGLGSAKGSSSTIASIKLIKYEAPAFSPSRGRHNRERGPARDLEGVALVRGVGAEDPVRDRTHQRSRQEREEALHNLELVNKGGRQRQVHIPANGREEVDLVEARQARAVDEQKVAEVARDDPELVG